MCEALDELYKDEIDKRVNRLADEKAEVLAEAKAKEHLTNLIKKKIAKGKSISQIADELEETEETIAPLYIQLTETT